MANPDTIVLDIRTPDEIAASGKIDHKNFHQVTVSLSDASALEECAPTVLPKKDAAIFIYCRSGRRATNAVRALQEMGYTNIMNGGGYDDVKAALEREDKVQPSQ